GDDDQEFDKEEYAEETRDEESFDPILKTPKNSDDEGSGEEDLGLNVGKEERHVEEEEEDELYRDRMNEAVKVAVQIQSDRLRDEAQRENDEFLKTVDENMQNIIKEHVKEQVKTSYAVAANLSEMELKKILIEKMRRSDDDADKDEEPSAGPDRGSKRRREGKEPESASAPAETATRSTDRSTQGSQSRQVSASESDFAEEPVQTTCQMEEPSHLEFDTGAEDQPIIQSSQHPEYIQPWISKLAKQTNSRSSFNERMDTPLDFSNFLINRLKVDTLTPKLLVGPTYKLVKGSCKSLVELEYHLEEVFKATTYQLDWVNPEGQQYPHNLLKTLPLIPNNRGRHVIPFEHFINNLEYLRGGASIRKYTTSITKTKAADYRNIKWIEDLMPRIMWIKEPIGYDKHALWGVSYWGRKLESYQKKLNLTKPDSYRSDLKRKEAYTAYSNLRGFIYQNKDKKNRLMRIDELHKFSDGTLTDVCTTLDDRLKGIRMQYLPQSIWRKSDKDRAAAMIQVIDKRLKTKRIMRSLERFIGGRLYEGDFRMLQRTI
nr:hypothetical protein [Tanacetum cinerariifolium]